MMWDGHDGMGWWMLWGGTLWLVFVVVLVFVAARLRGASNSAGVSPGHPLLPPTETPLDILRRRYASGEITRDQFEQIRQDLSDG
ncbi:MAG: SHOCT domain-containing protein [Tepidiformaceae bacterium]